MEIKNVILDLGGVLLNIDYSLTINKFKDLGIENFEELYTQAQQNKLFDEFEKGEIDADIFLEELNKLLPALSQSEIVAVWNEMLLDFPAQHFTFLLELKEKYNTVLLSNTNSIHLDYFQQKLKSEYNIDSLSNYFNNTYFSFEMGMRKPDIEIFKRVCTLEKFQPQETLFIDDTMQHVEGARRAGINAFHLDTKQTDVAQLIERIL